MLNEVPNNNDALCVGNNVWLYSHHAEKLTQQQERFMRTKINFALGKNGGYIPSGLGGRSISVGKQALIETKFFAI